MMLWYKKREGYFPLIRNTMFLEDDIVTNPPDIKTVGVISINLFTFEVDMIYIVLLNSRPHLMQCYKIWQD
jgi:hypothetical protein